MVNRYSIYFRPHQNKDASNNNIVYSQVGNNIVSTLGNEPNYVLTDVTSDCGDFKTTITFDRNNDFNRQGDNGVTERLTIIGKAYTYVNNYFFGTNYGHINSIDVLVYDNETGNLVKEFIMKADTIHLVPIDGCVMEVSIKEANSKYDILSKADLHDNWQNWFDGAFNPGVKQFPTFRTCLERFGASQRLSLNMLWITIAFPVAFIVNLAGEDDRIVRRVLGLGNFTTAPRVFDLIQNICMKCGLTQNTVFDVGKIYQDVCYISNNHSTFHVNNNGGGSPATWFDKSNREATFFIDWLDKLCDVMACYWWIDNGVLTIDFKINVISQAPFHDFTNDAIYNVSIDYSQVRKDRRHGLVYGTDDTASSQINVLYSDITDYDNGINNPMLDGNSTINTSQFASTGFVRDGTEDDYIREEIIDAEVSALINIAQLAAVVASLVFGIISALIAGVLIGILVFWVVSVIIQRGVWINDYASFFGNDYTGAIRLKNAESFNVGRLIEYNTSTPLNDAHALFTDLPTPNTPYNTLQYKQNYSVDANHGSSSNNFNQNGVDYRAFNYSLYYDHKFTNNLQQWHEPFYNPLINNKGERVVEFTICKTSALMTKFGLFDGNSVQINKVVLVDIAGVTVKVLVSKITLKTFENELTFLGTIIYN